jgi:phospholipase/carboxylesterase
MSDSSAAADLGFIHRFVPATDPALPPLLVLHGTGGDETDLLPLGARLAPGAALLSPRGRVLENGAPRFFRRLTEGVFDLKDLQFRTDELADFVVRAGRAYGIARPIVIGFSNGANIATSMLLRRPQVLAGGVLIRGTVPFEPDAPPDLAGMPVLILSGARDPLVPAAKRDRLAQILRNAGAEVTYEVLKAEHHLSADDLVVAGGWLDQWR